MFKNYLKVAFRFLLKNKTFSFINIIGLSIGTLCCLYILLYLENQYSYDKHHKDAQDIYRINSSLNVSGDKHKMATSSPPIAPAMKNDFPEVKQFTRVILTSKSGVKESLLRYKEKSFYEKDAVLVDSTFFDVFTYHFVYGEAGNVLKEPYTIVLLKTVADKLFGDENPLGKTIEIDNSYGKHDFKVTGVLDEKLGQSHISANLFIGMNSGGTGEYVRNNNDWAGNNIAASYVKLYPNANVASLEKKLPAFLNKYGQERLKNLGMEKQLSLQPVTSIHTTSGYESEIGKTISPTFLNILLLIAILIQFIACINFMNLATGRAVKRAKEVGVRKVIGAERSDLVKQFLSESFVLVFISVLIGVGLLFLTLPNLNNIIGANVRLTALIGPKFAILLAILMIVTGLVAGSYPAFFLSAFQAIKVIKGNFVNQIAAIGIRRSLVVFQFCLSTILVSAVIIIYQQLQYIKNKDLGFESKQKLIFSFHTQEAKKNIGSFVSDLRQLSEVKAVSRANNYPSQAVSFDWPFYLPGGNMSTAQESQFILTDEHFVKATGIQLVSGRDFRLYDTNRVLINETYARRLGLDPLTAPGTRLHTDQDEAYIFEVIGVMKDFNFNSLHESVKPLMFMYASDPRNLNTVIVNVNSNNYKALLQKIEAVWKKDIPLIPMEFSFLDDEVQKQYETELNLFGIINSFTIMTILISCLGLFGLASLSAEQRLKEIGIRKVLGASTVGIVQLLSKDFMKLVGIAIVIAVPVAWWIMNRWLDIFAYKVTIKWWMFGIAGLLAIIISIFTIGFLAIKAAVVNPVKTLRSE